MEHVTIKKCMIAVDVSMESIDEAVSMKANLIISHHPAFPGETEAILDIVHEKYRLLTTHNIWVYAPLESWTFAEEGIAESICQSLQVPYSEIFLATNGDGVNIPVGCTCNFEKAIMFNDLLQRVKNLVGETGIRWSFNGKEHVKKALVIPGEVTTTRWVLDAVRLKIDTVVGGEFSRHARLALVELGMNVIEASHYGMDLPGMGKLKFLLSLKHPTVDFILFEEPASGRC